MVPQLALQLACRGRLHGDGSRGSLSSLAHGGNLRLGGAFDFGKGCSVGSLDGGKRGLLVLLSGFSGVVKVLQSRCCGSSGSGGGCLLLLQLERERSGLLLRLRLQLGEGDLGLSLHTLQIHFALNLHIEGHMIFISQQTLNAEDI